MGLVTWKQRTAMALRPEGRLAQHWCCHWLLNRLNWMTILQFTILYLHAVFDRICRYVWCICRPVWCVATSCGKVVQATCCWDSTRICFLSFSTASQLIIVSFGSKNLKWVCSCSSTAGSIYQYWQSLFSLDGEDRVELGTSSTLLSTHSECAGHSSEPELGMIRIMAKFHLKGPSLKFRSI